MVWKTRCKKTKSCSNWYIELQGTPLHFPYPVHAQRGPPPKIDRCMSHAGTIAHTSRECHACTTFSWALTTRQRIGDARSNIVLGWAQWVYRSGSRDSVGWVRAVSSSFYIDQLYSHGVNVELFLRVGTVGTSAGRSSYDFQCLVLI